MCTDGRARLAGVFETTRAKILRDFGSRGFEDAVQPCLPVRGVATLVQYDTIAAHIAVMARDQKSPDGTAQTDAADRRRTNYI